MLKRLNLLHMSRKMLTFKCRKAGGLPLVKLFQNGTEFALFGKIPIGKILKIVPKANNPHSSGWL